MNLAKGLIGAAGGLGVGMVAVGQDQLKKNAELARVLREEAMQLSAQAHAETIQKGSFKHSEKLQEDSFRHSENLQKGGFEHAETLQSQNQGFQTKIAKMEADLKREQINIEKSKLNNDIKAAQGKVLEIKIKAIQEANKHLELNGSPEGANAILEEAGVNLEYKDVVTKKGEKGGWFSDDTPDETKTVLGKKGLVSSATTPGPAVAGSGPASGIDPDKQRIDSILSNKPKVSASVAPAKEDKGIFHGDVDLSNPLSRGFSNAMTKKDRYNEAKYGHLREK